MLQSMISKRLYYFFEFELTSVPAIALGSTTVLRRTTIAISFYMFSAWRLASYCLYTWSWLVRYFNPSRHPKRLTVLDIYTLQAPENPSCNVLNNTLCSIILRDTWTWILTAWIALQLIWVTMLLVVQLVQISRNQTTFENMKRHSIEYNLPNPSSRALTSALTTGSTSFEAGGLSSSGMGPNPVAAAPPASNRARGGCFAQWKKLLGLDTFMATASDGLTDRNRQRSRENVFSRGVITNCKDFFGDPAPYFGKRSSGKGMLGGEIVDYSQLYDAPLRTRARGARGMVYRTVPGEDGVGEDAV